MRRAVFLPLFVLIAALLHAVTPSVTVSPSSATLYSGQTQQFTATTTGMANHLVRWTATGGSISGSGLFTAPTVTSQTIITVKATSSNHPKIYATAKVTVNPTAPPPPPPPVAHTVDLTWQESAIVVGFNVYRGTNSTGPWSQINTGGLVAATLYTDATVASGATYYYVVTALDNTGAESTYSNVATAVIPSP